MLLVFALLFTAGAAAEEGGAEEDSSPAKITTAPTTEPTTGPTTLMTTLPTTKVTTVATTEVITAPATETPTVAATEVTTAPATETPTVAATEVPTQKLTETTQESETWDQKFPEQKQYADAGKSSLPESIEDIPGLLKKQKTIQEQALEETDAEADVSTQQEEEPHPVSVPSPQYLPGGTAESYPLLSGDARTVYPCSTAFVYEKIKIKITDTTCATSIAYMSGSANPSALNTIQVDANGVINLLDVSVGGYTGAYRIYDDSQWTGGYLYIWQPDLILRAEYAGSTDSVDGKAVSKSSSIHYIIDSPKVGPSCIGAKAQIIVTTPVGGQTTMLGAVSLADIDINSVVSQPVTSLLPTPPCAAEPTPPAPSG